MKKLALVILSLIIAGCSNLAPEEKELIGHWRTYGQGGGPSQDNIKPTKIDLDIRPDHTYSYDTPALQGYGLVANRLIDIPAKHQYGKWRIEKNSKTEEFWTKGGLWKACCICVTPEDGSDGNGCNPYTLEGDNLTTHFAVFPVPFLGDVIYPIEWKRTE